MSDIDIRDIDLSDTKLDLQDVFKTSWKTNNCYVEDVLNTSSRHVFKTSLRRLQDQQMFAGMFLILHFLKVRNSSMEQEILLLQPTFTFAFAIISLFIVKSKFYKKTFDIKKIE